MSSKESGSQSKRPANTAFKQQRLKAWQPILTPRPVILSFLIIGIVFIPIGAGIVYSSNQVVESDVEYTTSCNLTQSCNVSIEVKQKMKHPVYMYYRLENFYQNHRRYVKSRSDDQLKGLKVSSYGALTDCDPVIVPKGAPNKNASFLINPCGLIASSLFNDSFLLFDPSGQPVVLQKDGIAWKSDKEKKFKNPKDGPGIRVIPDFEDEDFIVWMRTAGLPDFKKLHRIINTDLEPGNYTVQVRNNFPVSTFSGKKHIVLSTTTWIGGRNPFLGYAYIVVGAICFILGIVFGVKHKVAPRKLGDTKYLEWNK
eukprot:Phypoly_transcript_10662.p1 GENE.Phypoly_transcript_10662~~Phypoly_transcript_10662.p1  ORF type:complete len:312 (+),score=34.73 Phypoly_transcript_10662:142-1077(+)